MINVRVEQINDRQQRSLYAEKILKALPQWFGNEEAVIDYINGVKDLPFFAAMLNEDCIGFMSIKLHYEHTGDLYVCGVLPDYHGQGVGKELFTVVQKYLIEKGCKYVMVKTLSEQANCEPYEGTRLFYKRVGFEELVTLTEIWDQENPCLIMIKAL